MYIKRNNLTNSRSYDFQVFKVNNKIRKIKKIKSLTMVKVVVFFKNIINKYNCEININKRMLKSRTKFSNKKK